jgi:hypothetical protein
MAVCADNEPEATASGVAERVGFNVDIDHDDATLMHCITSE